MGYSRHWMIITWESYAARLSLNINPRLTVTITVGSDGEWVAAVDPSVSLVSDPRGTVKREFQRLANEWFQEFYTVEEHDGSQA